MFHHSWQFGAVCCVALSGFKFVFSSFEFRVLSFSFWVLSWEPLGNYWAALGCSWVRRGSYGCLWSGSLVVLGALGWSWGLLGALWGGSWGLWGGLGGLFWELLGGFGDLFCIMCCVDICFINVFVFGSVGLVDSVGWHRRSAEGSLEIIKREPEAACGLRAL